MSRAFMVKQAPFKPTDIGGCQLWLDGADTTTLTGRSPVTAWRDKSTNNLTLTATGSPTVTTVNGLNSLSFNGSSSFLLNPFTQTASVTYISWFAVVNVTNAASAIYGCIVGTGYVSDNYTQNMMYIQPAGSLMIFYRRVRGDGGKNTTVPLSQGNVLLSTATDYTAGTYQVFQNGTAATLQTDGHTGTVDTQAVILRVGHDGFSGDSYVEGTISELLLYTTALTGAQRQQVESYLAQKWGLRQQLPQGHPGTRGLIYPIQRLPNASALPYQAIFSPLLIQPGSCQLWLDGSDTSTITGTTAVSAWTDKSGNGNNTTIFGTPNSTYGTINSVKAMWFNGSSGTYGLFSNTGATVSGFVVGTMNSATATYGRMIALGNNPGNDDSGTLQCPFLLRHIGNQAFSTRRFQTNYTYSSYTYDAPFLASIIYDGTNGNLYVNGSTIVQFGSTGNFGYSNYSVGCGIYSISANTVDTWAGFVGEVILYRSALTNTQRQQVEGYLAWKWGMQANLPANHPYKNSAPIGTTNPAGISRPANVLPIPSIACFPIRTYFLVTADLMLHVDAGNPASYPGSGSTWYDLTTSGLNVTLYNSPTYSSANGGYIAFTPSSSQYGGTSGTYNSSTALTRWTTEAWHYYTNTFVGNLSAIICSTYAGNVNFALGSPVGGAAGKNLAAAYYAGAWYYTSSSYSLPSVGWYHIVGTYDGTNLKLYVNNVLTQTQASAVTPGFGGGVIHLMRRWDVGDYWGGYLAIARIYKRALSADEVNTNYQVSKARFGLS